MMTLPNHTNDDPTQLCVFLTVISAILPKHLQTDISTRYIIKKRKVGDFSILLGEELSLVIDPEHSLSVQLDGTWSIVAPTLKVYPLPHDIPTSKEAFNEFLYGIATNKALFECIEILRIVMGRDGLIAISIQKDSNKGLWYAIYYVASDKKEYRDYSKRIARADDGLALMASLMPHVYKVYFHIRRDPNNGTMLFELRKDKDSTLALAGKLSSSKFANELKLGIARIILDGEGKRGIQMLTESTMYAF
jgi:hypothetical protein